MSFEVKETQSSKEQLKKREARERDIAEDLRMHDSQTHRKGETLPQSTMCIELV